MHSTHAILIVCALSTAFVGCAFSPLDTSFSPIVDSGPYKNNYGYRPSADDASATDSGLSDNPDASLDSGPGVEPIEASVPDTRPPATCSLPLATGEATCDSCLGQSCCALDEACGNDPQCLDLINCMGNCESVPGGGVGPDAGAEDPTACLNACSAQYPAASNELEQLDNCISASCPAACQ